MRTNARQWVAATAVLLLAALLHVNAITTSTDNGNTPLEFTVSRKSGSGKEGRRLSHDAATAHLGTDLGFKELGFTYRENDGVYWADLRIGTPQQDFSVIVDTGSSTIAIPCKGCKCGAQHHYFDRAASTSSTVQRANGYRQCYSEGSCNHGDMLKDKICIGNECTPAESVAHPFGCCSTFASAFQKQEADGIIGLSLNGRTLVADLQQHHRLKQNTFALCFGASKGVFVVGGFPEDRHMEPIQWTPMTQKSGEFYNVKVTKVSVNGESIAIPGGSQTPIVDSGTTFTYLPRALHASMRKQFTETCKSSDNLCLGSINPHGTPGADLRDAIACFSKPADVGMTKWLSSFPHIEWEFDGGARVCLPSQQYFFKSKGSIYCIGMFPDSKFVIGAINMAEFDVVFDQEKGRVGWARANCDGGVEDQVSTDASCCGTCAEYRAKVSKPHTDVHKEIFDITRLNNGRLILKPKVDLGPELGGFTLKDKDNLVLDRAGTDFVLCPKGLGVGEGQCTIQPGSLVTVKSDTSVSLPATLVMGGDLVIEAGATAVTMKPKEALDALHVNGNVEVNGTFNVLQHTSVEVGGAVRVLGNTGAVNLGVSGLVRCGRGEDIFTVDSGAQVRVEASSVLDCAVRVGSGSMLVVVGKHNSDKGPELTSDPSEIESLALVGGTLDMQLNGAVPVIHVNKDMLLSAAPSIVVSVAAESEAAPYVVGSQAVQVAIVTVSGNIDGTFGRGGVARNEGKGGTSKNGNGVSVTYAPLKCAGTSVDLQTVHRVVTLMLPSAECLKSCESSTLDSDSAPTSQCSADIKNAISWSVPADTSAGGDAKHKYSKDGMRNFAFTTGLAIVLISVGVYVLCRARSTTEPVAYQRV